VCSEVTTFLCGGAALDINSVHKKPKFILGEAWLNTIELSNQNSFFKALPDNVMRNSDAWKAI
jgi:dynein heavy chain